MLDWTTAALALAGGTAGNIAGKSDKVGGETPWNKVLAPAGAILLPILVKKISNKDMSFEEAAAATMVISTSVSGIYSYGKNFLQLVSHLFKKGK